MELEWSELREMLARSNRRRIPVFFRDDDATSDIPSLRRMLHLFEERRVPINIEVIPGLLTSDGTGLLSDSATRNPGLIGINQHGWRHENHEPTGKRCEFGASRSNFKQEQDIRAGRQILEDSFGELFFPVFTPPWNRYTSTTCRILAALDYAAISAFTRSDYVTDDIITHLPATIDIIDWRGNRNLRPVDELLAGIAAQFASTRVIGVLLHHQAMNDYAFEFLARLLDLLIDSGKISFHLFPSLLRSDQ